MTHAEADPAPNVKTVSNRRALSPGRWRLAVDLETTLRRMGERDDIIKTMHREMAEKGVARSAADYAIYDHS